MNWNRTLTIFGKQISVVAIALLAMAGLASAGLLSYYGMVTATSTVSQSIILTGTGCTNNQCPTSISAAGSEKAYSGLLSVDSKTINDLDVKFTNVCNPDCGGITVTNMVGLGVDGFADSNLAFDDPYYKATNYVGPATIGDLNNITYSFKITVNSFDSTTLAPYLVISASGLPSGAAVYMIPDGGTYTIGTEYTKIVDGSSKFHVPGDDRCTQASPCTLTQIKSYYPTVTITRIRLALGAWPGSGHIEATMGIGTINGEQAVHKSLPVPHGTSIPVMDKYDFAPAISPGTYTITTDIVPL